MSSAQELLDRADELLTQGSRSSNRIACWVARTALEETVNRLLDLKNSDPGQCSMASRLTCLEIAYIDVPQLAETAEYAWAGLSQASHQHAFRLDPTAVECRHLISLVQQLIQRTNEAALALP